LSNNIDDKLIVSFSSVHKIKEKLMIELIPEIQSRRAFRAISEKPVPTELLKQICEAGALAPSCANA
jgi:hypothetical protein